MAVSKNQILNCLHITIIHPIQANCYYYISTTNSGYFTETTFIISITVIKNRELKYCQLVATDGNEYFININHLWKNQPVGFGFDLVLAIDINQ